MLVSPQILPDEIRTAVKSVAFAAGKLVRLRAAKVKAVARSWLLLWCENTVFPF